MLKPLSLDAGLDAGRAACVSGVGCTVAWVAREHRFISFVLGGEVDELYEMGHIPRLSLIFSELFRYIDEAH